MLEDLQKIYVKLNDVLLDFISFGVLCVIHTKPIKNYVQNGNQFFDQLKASEKNGS